MEQVRFKSGMEERGSDGWVGPVGSRWVGQSVLLLFNIAYPFPVPNIVTHSIVYH